MHHLNLHSKQTSICSSHMTCAYWKDVREIPLGIRAYKMFPVLLILVTCHITTYSYVTSSTQLNKDLKQTHIC